MDTETIQKIYLSDNNKATFQCPKCQVSKEADVSKYKKLETSIKLTVKCSCENLYSVILERRKFFRKETNFPGKFSFCPLLGRSQKSLMTVLDISRGGLKFKMTSVPLFKKGDIIEVEFNLDNSNKTLIKKQVFVRNIKDNFVNVEFCAFDTNHSEDKALGFYLL